MKFKKTLAASAVVTVIIFFAAVLPAFAEPAEIKTYLPIVKRTEQGDIDNPGFEEGQTGWEFYSNYVGNMVTSSRAHTGSYSSRLGSSTQNGREASISQQVTVPNGNFRLTYWHYVDSQEGACPSSWTNLFDFVSIRVNGQRIAAYNLCGESMVNNQWEKKTISMYNYRGQTISLQIYYWSDQTLPSDFYVDDFAFE